MLLDEARLASRIQHPNVVSELDVVADGDELASSWTSSTARRSRRSSRRRTRRQEAVPAGIAVAVVVNALRGLHAAHEALGEDAKPLGLVHRDVTPAQRDGRPRRHRGRPRLRRRQGRGALSHDRRRQGEGQAPVHGARAAPRPRVTRKVDVYAAGVDALGDPRRAPPLLRRERGRGPRAGPLRRGRAAERGARVEPVGARRGGDARHLARGRRIATPPRPSSPTRSSAAFAPALPSQVATWLEGLAKPGLDQTAARLRAIDADHRAEKIELPQRVRDAMKRSAEAEPDTKFSSAVLDAAVAGVTPATSTNAPTRVSLPDDGSIASGALAKAAAAATPPARASRRGWTRRARRAADRRGRRVVRDVARAARRARRRRAFASAERRRAGADRRRGGHRQRRADDAARRRAAERVRERGTFEHRAVDPAGSVTHPIHNAPRPAPKKDCVQVDADGHHSYNRDCLK